MIKSKMYIFIITFVLCVFCFNSINTYATEGKTTYDITINRGPRISFDLTDSKNVIINVKDSQGVKSVKVEQYSNSKWKNITSKILVSKIVTGISRSFAFCSILLRFLSLYPGSITRKTSSNGTSP